MHPFEILLLPFIVPVLLSGCSAGGLATFHHCDDLSQLLPKTVIVKCLSDGGFFLTCNCISV